MARTHLFYEIKEENGEREYFCLVCAVKKIMSPGFAGTAKIGSTGYDYTRCGGCDNFIDDEVII
jgi:hypothetical protein